MNQNKPIKLNLKTILLIIAIIVIAIVGFYIYASNNNKTNIEQDSVLKLGEYNINGPLVDPSEGLGISCITLKDNNQFSINLSYAVEYTGTYTIDDNTLICTCDTEITHEGGPSNKDCDTIFEFSIINNSKVEFSTVLNTPYFFNLGDTFSVE